MTIERWRIYEIFGVDFTVYEWEIYDLNYILVVSYTLKITKISSFTKKRDLPSVNQMDNL